jgi:hypothetical protein
MDYCRQVEYGGNDCKFVVNDRIQINFQGTSVICVICPREQSCLFQGRYDIAMVDTTHNVNKISSPERPFMKLITQEAKFYKSDDYRMIISLYLKVFLMLLLLDQQTNSPRDMQ